MTIVTNGRLLFNEIPIGYPEPGTTTIYDDSKTIDLDNVPLDGGILVKTIALSIDPYLRSRMRDPQVKSYASAFIKGEPLNNFGIGKVIRSENSSAEVGQHIYGVIPFEHYFVLPDLSYHRVIVNEQKLPWHLYTGVLGAAGQTAWCAWKEWIRPKEGDVVFVTTGGGPVGSFLIQLAKEAGLKVIASAGSEEKIEFMKSLGADVTFNYKTERPADVLKREGPINIYWDNVGGESLEAALEYAAKEATFIACGYISEYNGAPPYPVNNLRYIFGKEIKMYGFILTTILHKYEEDFYKEVPRLVASGQIKHKEDVTDGLEYAGHAIRAVQAGTNQGKSVVIVSKD